MSASKVLALTTTLFLATMFAQPEWKEFTFSEGNFRVDYALDGIDVDLLDPDVENVLAIVRKTSLPQHVKLREIVHQVGSNCLHCNVGLQNRLDISLVHP